jgi:hypothetical protein
MHTEGMIAADPADPRKLIACSMFLTERSGQSVAVYQSADGGAHWQRTFESPAEEFIADPACTFGPDGVAYLTMMPLTVPSLAAMRLPLWRSTDGGLTWQSAARTGGMDRESIVVDATGGRFHNRIYIHGSSHVRGTDGVTRSVLMLYASSDGGRSFERPAQWVTLGRGHIFGPSNSVVLSDGTWLTVFTNLKAYWNSADTTGHEPTPFSSPPEAETARLEAIASRDGGDTLNEPVVISGEYQPNEYVRMTAIAPAVASDSTDGPFRDRIYTAWSDSRFGGSNILLSYSADRGQTWSAPTVVNDDPHADLGRTAPNHLMPAVAVNNDGVVAVTWLDRRDASDNLGWRERIRVSLDGGETFPPSVLVSEAPAQFDGAEHWPAQAGTSGGGTPLFSGGPLHVEVFSPRFLYVPGDYATLAADANGIFHPYWIDNRTGWHQVWTADVHVTGKAVRNGSEALASLDDLTPLTTLHRITNHYDRETATASVTVRLENTSHQTLEGPFTLRLITLGSDVATVAALATSNHLPGPGATWTVPGPAAAPGRLAPGERSEPFTLTFSLRDVRPFVQGHTDHFDLRLVKFDVRVLGRVADPSGR